MAVVNQLPDTVGTTNKEALRSAGENLQKLAQDPSQCKPSPTGASGLQGDQSTSTSTTTTEAVPTTPTTTTTHHDVGTRARQQRQQPGRRPAHRHASRPGQHGWGQHGRR